MFQSTNLSSKLKPMRGNHNISLIDLKVLIKIFIIRLNERYLYFSHFAQSKIFESCSSVSTIYFRNDQFVKIFVLHAAQLATFILLSPCTLCLFWNYVKTGPLRDLV